MLTRSTKNQLAAFVALSATTVTYSAIAYLDVAQLVGYNTYDLTIEMRDSGGLYDGSVVTLSGSPVGEVTSVAVTRNGVVATARIDDDARIPTNAFAQVRSISAAGEQYLNFATPDEAEAAAAPRTADAAPKTSAASRASAGSNVPANAGPFLEDGSIVPASAVSVPIETSELLTNVTALVNDVPPDSLDTTVTELGTGLANGERDLRRAVDELIKLQTTFTANTDSTVGLVDDLQAVLSTQRSADPQLRTLTGRLAQFTDQLARDDAKLRGTLRDTPPLANEVDRLVTALGTTLPVLLSNLISVGEVTTVYDASLRQTLTVLPGVTNAFQQAVNTSPVDGAVSLFLRTLAADPQPCTQGFVQNRRSPAMLAPRVPPTTAYCQVPAGSPQAVRGARNYACPNASRRGPTAASCGLIFQDPAETRRVQQRALRTQVAVAAKQRRSATGKLTGPRPRIPSTLLSDLSAPLPALPQVTSLLRYLATLPDSRIDRDQAWRFLVLSQLPAPRNAAQ